ncbi:ankyrin repeat domain-containing protein [Demequina sp. B12]|uniref:ankyrin repeat domain-containing protein n=1 Tax=Demequina sp. B12 TaxID=2992757 RepID=UPI00237A9129|nr:ankyrin repeat domain-containing protein [Demequina sp. B12]MDE0572751.1 ankyrin repeat domain-containing protein [Demequina sp. B12]
MKIRIGLVAGLAAVGVALTACSADGDNASDGGADTEATVEAATVTDAPLDEQLEQAIGDGNTALVDALIEGGVDPEADFGLGFTPLRMAITGDHTEIVEALIAAGADAAATDAIGYNSLHTAGLNQASAETTQLLLDAGADPEQFDESIYNASPLHLAARNDSVDALQAMVDSGADPDLVNPMYGANPLFFAAESDQVAAAQYLIDIGADYNHTDLEGQTLLGEAYEFDATGVIALLEELGAERVD